MSVKMDGAHFEALIADMESALRELVAPVERDPSLWTRGPAGKWTAGQHVAHLATLLALSADAYEKRATKLREGQGRPRPWRGPLQALFVTLIVGGGKMPRGAKAAQVSLPPDAPDRESTLAAITRDVARHRALGEKLTPDERDRLWARNPFRPSWHYTFPEAVRMHALHARHHARQVEEIAAGK